MQNLTTPKRTSIISTVEMTPDVLTSQVKQVGGFKVDSLFGAELWATEHTVTKLDSKFVPHAQPRTPQVLSSSNSVTGFESMNRRHRGKKSKTFLFNKRLTFKELGVKNFPDSLEYLAPEAKPSEDKTMRLASQDLLIFKSPPMPVKMEFPTRNTKQSSNDSVPNDLKQSRARQNHLMLNSTTNSKSSMSTLAHLKRRVKFKLEKSRNSRPGYKQARKGKYKPLQPNRTSGGDQHIEKIEMNTGTLYMYRGGDMPRRAVFIRRK